MTSTGRPGGRPPDAIVVIGDEASCAGFRLAGVAVRTPPPDDVARSVEEALGHARLVVLTREMAAVLPRARLRAVLAQIEPLVVVVPGIASSARDDGFARRIRAVLGIEA